jgi:hypothetical protein
MKDDLFNSFKARFDALQTNTANVRERAEAIIQVIQSGAFIPGEDAEQLAACLDTYRSELLAFREAGKELAIDVEAGIEPVRQAIVAYENERKLIAERQLVLDYLRLSTETENVIAQLEESKQLLIQKCRGEDAKDQLRPFGLVVDSVKAQVSGLADDVYDIIHEAIGRPIARALDRGNLFIDESLEITAYLDGSCELLKPLNPVAPSAESIAQPEAPATTPSTDTQKEFAPALKTDNGQSEQEVQELSPLWDHFDGYVDERSFEIPDIPSIRFNSHEFMDAGILPESFLQSQDNGTLIFSLRVCLIKQYINKNNSKVNGLSLFCVDQDLNYPCVCWAEQTDPAQESMDVQYVVAGLFSRGNERDEIYNLRKLIVSSAPAKVTIVALSEDDRRKINKALNLGETNHVEYSVLPLSETKLVAEGIEDLQPIQAATQPGHEVVFVKAENRIKEAKPSANAFLSDLAKIGRSQETSEIITLISYFGVISEKTITPLSKVAFGEKEGAEEANKESILFEQLKQLTAKNILAHYRTGEETEEDDLYCFTQYGYSCLHKDTVIKQVKRVSDQRIGDCRFIGKQEMKLQDLLYMNARTNAVFAFLNEARSFFDAATHAGIVSSILANEECALSIELPVKDERHRYSIVLPNELVSGLDQLVLANADPTITLDWIPYVSADRILVFYQSKLYYWDKANWSLLLPDSSTSEERKESEPIKQAEEEPQVFEGEAQVEEPSQLEDEPDVPARSDVSLSTEPPVLEEKQGDEGDAQYSIMLQEDKPSDAQFVQAIESLVGEQTIDAAEVKNYRALANALMLAKASSFDKRNTQANLLYQKLLAATNIPIGDFDYTGENLSSLFGGDTEEDEALKLSAFSHAMFAPQKPYDYTLDSVCDQLIENYDLIFPSYPKYKGLFIKLNEIRKVVPEGFSGRIISLLGDQAERQAHSNRIAAQAKGLIEVPTTNTTGLPGHKETLIDCFGPDSEIGLAMKLISDGKSSERAFVEGIYQGFCKENGKISQNKIDEFIEEVWRKNRKHRTGLVAKARTQVDNAFWARLELIKEWLDADFDSAQVSANTIKNLRASLVREIDKELAALKHVEQTAWPALLYWSLQSIKAKLELKDTLSEISVFSGILFSGLISMADNGLPILEKEMAGVQYYEPWRNVLKHIQAPVLGVNEIKDGIIFDESSPLHDNYRQLRMLGKYLKSDSDEYSVEKEDLNRARDSANAAERQFRQELEFAYTNDRISEADKERLSALLEYRESFYEREDFACWKAYLAALEKQIEEISAVRKNSLKQRLEGALETLAEGETCPLLEAARELLEQKQNFAVAEEYLNRFDAGERELSAETNLLRNEERTFEEFISPEVYNPIFAECSKKANRGGNFRSFAKTYISARFPTEWTDRYEKSALSFVSNWPYAKGNTTEANIRELLWQLGLDVQNVNKVKNSPKVEHFKATVKSSPRNQADYQHPISAFGTQVKNPINVLVLYGKNDPTEIVTKVNSMNLGENTIVFIDYPLALADRRSVAEYFHKSTSGQNSFLLIDQVLAVFLALKTSAERLPAFLKCTLPFTRYQPFVFDGGPTADDMFCGRVSELQKILDPQGACVVYGGRQLGKTALLQRAESLRSKPEDSHYAVYTNIIKITSEKDAVSRLVADINKKTGLRLRDVDSIKDLADQIGSLFREGAIRSLLLLIDEADDFLESISANNYVQLQPFVDLKRETHNDFKFVLAGLHNVYRTKNATDRNGVFGQLGTPLCIKPLSPTDALQLISRPLMYLGFQVDRYPHLETILTNTNYYPGILQFFGYNLVQSVPLQYGEYFSAKSGNPPFTLEEKQLSAIMTSNDLNNSIKEKFRLSLKLDKRYFMLARVIALLYFENDVPETSRDGFSAAQILDYAKDLGIHCLEGCTYNSAINLLDEMVEMGILNRVEQTKGYCLRRRSFLNIIGTDGDSLLDEIVMENEETE